MERERKKVQVFDERPEGFLIQARVAGAFIVIERQLLLLQSASHKEYAGQWGLPAGKLEEGESAESALRREVFEETKIDLDDLPASCDFYARKSNIYYVFHLFKFNFTIFPDVLISEEHLAYKWVPVHETHTLPLIEGAPEIFAYL